MNRIMLVFYILMTACLAMADPMLPENMNDQAVTGKPVNSGAIPSGAVQLFQRYISPIDGDRCPMYPSCSAYSLGAFKKHGLVLGWIMTCDRLLRCGRDEWAEAPHVVINGELRCSDSVEHNDFWWTK